MRKSLPSSGTNSVHTRIRISNAYGVLLCIFVVATAAYSFLRMTPRADLPTLPDFVFVSRPIADYGTFYVQLLREISREDGTDTLSMPKGMPGVGGHSRFRVSPGGKLIIRKSDGTFKVLIDGSKPGKVPGTNQDLPFKLVDVNAPDVSYDATKIVFAGAIEGNYEPITFDPAHPRTVDAKDPNAWRLYVINVDGTGLKQVTYSDRNISLAQFAGPYGDNKRFESYDDTDPAWLPDGRIVFSSTRFPVYSHYTGVRSTHLYVVNENGSKLHRITTERNSADRPVVDPLTGRIVFSRWWRNQHYPYDDITTIRMYSRAANPDVNSPVEAGYDIYQGVTGSINASTENSSNGVVKKLPDHNMFRNSWQLQAVNPDGSHLSMFAGVSRDEEFTHAYGGTFDGDGNFVANYYPMANMTEAAGFGGIRRFKRGAGKPEDLIGVNKLMLGQEMTYKVVRSDGSIQTRSIERVYKSDYASDPAILPDGKMIISWLPNNYKRMLQDYGLYWFDPANRAAAPVLIYNNPGTAELRAKPILPRPKPPIIPDAVTGTESDLPPTGVDDIDKDGTFVFEDLNVFFNAPVDVPIVSAPKIGDVKSIRFYANPQRHTVGSYPNLEWPLFLKEMPIDDNGGVRDNESPANVQLFEQLRTPGGKVPLTGGPKPDGTGHVAGLNFGRPGQVVRCVGCHAGHSMIPVPESLEDQLYTNLAPGANITVSSSLEYDNKNHVNYTASLIDRMVLMDASNDKVWVSKRRDDISKEEWVELTFDVPIRVREVKLYNFKIANPDPLHPDGKLPVKAMNIDQATVTLYTNATDQVPVATTQVNGPLGTSATSAKFLGNDLFPRNFVARKVKVAIKGNGALRHHTNVVGLGEIEVIAAANTKEDPLPVKLLNFAAEKENSSVQLRWATSEEVNSDHFEIQRSATGKTWQKIGEIAASGDSKGIKLYQFEDRSPLQGNNLYRLKMIDQDKSFTFSRIRSVHIEGFQMELVVYPNPASHEVTLSSELIATASGEWTVTNVRGQVVARQKVQKGQGNAKFATLSWPAGNYQVVLQTASAKYTRKLVISH